MGCGSGYKENLSEKIILLKKVKSKVLQLIKSNSLYSISIKEFNKFMEEQSKKNSIETMSKSIISTFFKEDEENTRNIFINVASFSYSKFKYIFHKYIKDEEIKRMILYFIFLFLTENKRSKNNLLYKKLNKIFDKIKIKEEDGIMEFRTGKFSFVLLNLIQLHTFCFIYFFCSQGVLEIAGNFRKYELKTIYSSELKSDKYRPKNINKLFNKYLYYINQNIQPNKVNYIILTDVLQPLSEYISENKDEEIFSLNREKLKEILDVLIEKMNHKYYFDLFFNLENILE